MRCQWGSTRKFPNFSTFSRLKKKPLVKKNRERDITKNMNTGSHSFVFLVMEKKFFLFFFMSI